MKVCTTEQEYLDQIIEPARRCCKRYGYLPSVLIAQSCLENGYGIRSYWDNPQIEALMKYNNMVGIKSELLNNSWVNCGQVSQLLSARQKNTMAAWSLLLILSESTTTSSSPLPTSCVL